MAGRAPHRDEVADRLRAILEDDAARAEVSAWAQGWIEKLGELDEADTKDRAVWRAMVRMVGVHLPNADGTYADGAETVRAWLDDLTGSPAPQQ
jgi:hypothetical protein